MSRIAIITDSSSGLSADLIARYDLRVLPYYILAGGRMLRDGIQISRDEIFRLLRDGRHLPNTKAPSQADYAGLYRSLLGQFDAALVIVPSRERTAAYQHAESARAQNPELPVTLLDSRSTAAGQALVVLAAARARQAGRDLEAIVAAAQSAIDRMEFWIVLASLKFAARSGRVPNIGHYLGSMVKPVPVLRYEDGAPHIAFTARSAERAIERLRDELVDRVSPSVPSASQRVYAAIGHAGDVEQAEAIRAWLQSTWSPAEVHMLELPPILAVYSGPDAVGVAVYSEE
jgi:DegV family protein with EDD domain